MTLPALPPKPRDILRYWASHAAARIAIAGPEPLTYETLLHRAENVQSILHEKGAGRGTRVGLSQSNSADYVASLFGIIQSGATAVPLDPRLPRNEVYNLLDSSSCDLWIVERGSEYEQGEWELTGTAEGCDVYVRRRVLFAVEGHLAAALVLQFSSGTSSEPKRIPRGDMQIFEDYCHFGSTLELNCEDRYLAVAPFYHAYGALGLWATLAFGGCVLPLRRFMPASVLQNALSFLPTFVLLTPQMIDALSRCGLKKGQENAFVSSRHVISSTSPLGPEQHQQFYDRYGARAKIQYGSSETLSATLVRDGVYAPGRVGTPYPGVEVAIFDDDGQRLPVGFIGNVGIKSAANCDEYEGHSVGEVRRVSGFVLPGDRGSLDSSGELFLLGRDDVLNLGGYKVSPAEIEAVVRQAFHVSFVKVLTYSRNGVPSLRAVIETDDPMISVSAVSELCRQRLLAYKVPSRIDIIPTLPRDENGKVPLKSLRSILESI